MVKRKVGPVLAEILAAIEGIETYTAGKSLGDFRRDWLLRLATQRALEIISEACRHIPDEVTGLTPEVPWKKIRGVGNVLRHEYHRIADDVIWAVVAENIQPLKEAILFIRQSIEPAERP